MDHDLHETRDSGLLDHRNIVSGDRVVDCGATFCYDVVRGRNVNLLVIFLVCVEWNLLVQNVNLASGPDWGFI